MKSILLFLTLLGTNPLAWAQTALVRKINCVQIDNPSFSLKMDLQQLVPSKKTKEVLYLSEIGLSLPPTFPERLFMSVVRVTEGGNRLVQATGYQTFLLDGTEIKLTYRDYQEGCSPGTPNTFAGKIKAPGEEERSLVCQYEKFN